MNGFPRLLALLGCMSGALACGNQPTPGSPTSQHEGQTESHASTSVDPNTPAKNAAEPPTPAELSRPPTEACIASGGPVVTFARTPTNVELVVTHDRPDAWDHVGLPLEYPNLTGLPADWAPQATRTYVITEKGILVALNDGEGNDGGLYWLPKGEQQPQRVTTVGAAEVRWVFSTTFGIIGVSGLCHGSCPLRSSVSKLTPGRAPKSWKIKPIAQLDGCPSALSLANSDVLFIANGCNGTLTRLDRKGTSSVAQWPTELFPMEVTASLTDSEPAHASYYVSFGRVAAKFTANTTQWFAPAECVDVERSDSGCHCK